MLICHINHTYQLDEWPYAVMGSRAGVITQLFLYKHKDLLMLILNIKWYSLHTFLIIT